MKKKISKLSMNFCDKCGEDVDTLEPCVKIEYGFNNPDNSFHGLEYIILHLSCFNDADSLDRILRNFDKN
tara:strand:+ start:650 stop:859 length:210 start_codon:yes stop_codon:yes gene_type:complete